MRYQCVQLRESTLGLVLECVCMLLIHRACWHCGGWSRILVSNFGIARSLSGGATIGIVGSISALLVSALLVSALLVSALLVRALLASSFFVFGTTPLFSPPTLGEPICKFAVH